MQKPVGRRDRALLSKPKVRRNGWLRSIPVHSNCSGELLWSTGAQTAAVGSFQPMEEQHVLLRIPLAYHTIKEQTRNHATDLTCSIIWVGRRLIGGGFWDQDNLCHFCFDCKEKHPEVVHGGHCTPGMA